MPKDNAPDGSGAINFDSYLTATPPPVPVTTGAVKVINPTDKKTGPPKPTGLPRSAVGAFLDSYYE